MGGGEAEYVVREGLGVGRGEEGAHWQAGCGNGGRRGW